MPWVDTWPGGRVWKGRGGRFTYHIKKQIDGRDFECSTRCSSLTPAMKQLDRFLADPAGYSPAGVAGEPLVLAELVEPYLAWCEEKKGNSPEWIGKKRAALKWWQGKLGRRDLRRVGLGEQLRPALDGAPGERHKIEAIKALYAWLREERAVLKPGEDPTLGALRVPQARPEQWVTPKAIPRADHDQALRQLGQPWRDCLVVLAGTGWHVTELERFVRGGQLLELPAATARGHGASRVLVCPRRKSGEEQRTAVSRKVAAAAARLRARGTFSMSRLYQELRKVGVLPGRYRHTVATWAVEQGSDPAAVAAFLGHKSPATTRRFYATLATVPKVPTLA